MAEHTLQSLVGLPYNSYRDFVNGTSPDELKPAIEKLVGHTIGDGPTQPLFDLNGEPLRYDDNRPIILPWMWGTAASQKIMRLLPN